MRRLNAPRGPVRRAALTLVAVAAMAGAEAGAQGPVADLPMGERLRVSVRTLRPRTVVGRYDGRAADSLFLVPTPTNPLARIPLAEITRLEVTDGRHRGRGAVLGALAGLGAGIAGGVLCGLLCQDGALAPIGGLFLGVVVGMPAGGVLGATVLAPPRWRLIPVPAATRQ